MPETPIGPSESYESAARRILAANSSVNEPKTDGQNTDSGAQRIDLEGDSAAHRVALPTRLVPPSGEAGKRCTKMQHWQSLHGYMAVKISRREPFWAASPGREGRGIFQWIASTFEGLPFPACGGGYCVRLMAALNSGIVKCFGLATLKNSSR